MQKISIETTQNVNIDYVPAGLGDRILAYVIDGLVMLAYFGVLLLVFSLLTPDSLLLNIALIIPPFLYHLLCEIFMNGQSIGKRQMKIKVVKLDGAAPGIGAYLLRWILRPIDISIFSGGIAILTIAITRNSQRLGDLAAGTTVVKTEIRQDIPVFAVEDDYIPQFQEVTTLTDADVEVIQKVLKVYRDSGNSQPVIATAEKMKNLLSIDADMPPLQFLYTLVKDYKSLTAVGR